MAHDSRGASALAKFQRAPIEDHLQKMLDAKSARQGKGSYKPRNAAEVTERLDKFLAANGHSGRARNLRRMGGGASKEQFIFELEEPSGEVRKLVLRMDPLEGIVETSRARETQLLRAIEGVVPAPEIDYVDPDGDYMGQPAMIARFINGVTKPSDDGSVRPSGLGVVLGDRIGGALTPQYIDNLVATHTFDYRSADLSLYSIPRPGTTDAALWQLNFWTRVMADDATDASPAFAYAENWLRERLPVCETPVLLHGDYRLGNFMFDESTLQMTAILDWELAHIGDFHEDVSYSLEPVFCSRDDSGTRLVAAMMPVPEFLRRYEEASGNKVNPETLHWYRILNCYKLAGMNFASGARAALDGTNHQSAFLGCMSAVSHPIMATLLRLLDGENV